MCQGCTWSAGANGKAIERGATGRTIAGTHSHCLIIENDQLPALVASLMGGSTARVTKLRPLTHKLIARPSAFQPGTQCDWK